MKFVKIYPLFFVQNCQLYSFSTHLLLFQPNKNAGRKDFSFDRRFYYPIFRPILLF